MWAYVRGGMGGITQAMARSFQARGGEIRTGAPVERILVERGRAVGAVLRSGEEIRSRWVVSNAGPKRTFVDMLVPGDLPPGFLEKVRGIRYGSATSKMNLALGGVPDWKALPSRGRPGPQHRGTMHISPSMDYIEEAYLDARQGRPSRSPVLECTMASVLDPTVAPEGKHVMSVFVQYAPYRLHGSSWANEREAFADRCVDILEEYAPGFKGLIEGKHLLSPADLESEYGLTGGNIFHGEMSLDQLFFMRPLPQRAPRVVKSKELAAKLRPPRPRIDPFYAGFTLKRAPMNPPASAGMQS